jgi:hypothetical protein
MHKGWIRKAIGYQRCLKEFGAKNSRPPWLFSIASLSLQPFNAPWKLRKPLIAQSTPHHNPCFQLFSTSLLGVSCGAYQLGKLFWSVVAATVHVVAHAGHGRDKFQFNPHHTIIPGFSCPKQASFYVAQMIRVVLKEQIHAKTLLKLRDKAFIFWLDVLGLLFST